MPAQCQRLQSVPRTSRTGECEECLAIGDARVHLRLCRTGDHVGCCDSSKNKHATKHVHATHHPIMTSVEQSERWSWCYVDEVAMELDA